MKLAAVKVTALSSVPLTEIGASVGAVLLVFNSTLTFLELRFETTISGLPSLLKSADATVKGFEPTAKLTCALNEPSPLPFSTARALA